MWLDRWQAGLQLTTKLKDYKLAAIILAIPKGGVPVGAAIARQLRLPLSLIVVRKIPIPWAPEAGFGAVGPDGTVYLNRPLVKRLRLTKEKIQRLVVVVLGEIRRRLKVYGTPKIPDVSGRTVIIVDDGLASGYTAIAAIKTLRKAKPKEIIVAVPVASASALKEVSRYAKVVTLVTDRTRIFAVANWYQNFPDLTDQEVIGYLARKT